MLASTSLFCREAQFRHNKPRKHTTTRNSEWSKGTEPATPEEEFTISAAQRPNPNDTPPDMHGDDMLTPRAAPRILALSAARATDCDGEHESMEGIKQRFAAVHVWLTGRPWAVRVGRTHVWLRQCADRRSSRRDGGRCVRARSCREWLPTVWLSHDTRQRSAPSLLPPPL